MKKEITLTADGSHTIRIPEMNVSYHSMYGAIRESMHVFINAGLLSDRFKHSTSLRIFEMGFGTGLNALLTCGEAEKQNLEIHYTAVELYPITTEEASLLKYTTTPGQKILFDQLHQCEWNREETLTPWFTLKKLKADFIKLSAVQPVDLVYYDAFDPSVQPELWTEAIFEKVFSLLQPNGILVTYSSKGTVRRAMLAAGFKIEKLQGPPGKREMLRARKAGL